MAIGSYHFIVAMVAAWVSREQGSVIEYLKEENKTLREQLGDKRLVFTDAQYALVGNPPIHGSRTLRS